MTKKRTELTADQLRGQVRSAVFERSEDQNSSVIRFPVASDTPIQRWYGQEILSHKPGAMVMGERQKTLPLLFNHDRNKLIGIVEKLDQDEHRTYATVRFSSSEDGQKAKAMVDERVLVNCSFQYEIRDYDEIRGENREDDQIIATSWEIFEVSLVTIPADSNVGVYRHFETNLKEKKMATRDQENSENTVNDSKQQVRENVREAAIAEARRVEAEREQVRKAERQRIENIYSLCRQFNIEDSERENMIRSNESIENIRSHVLDLLGNRSAAPVGAASRGISEDIGLTATERSNFSLVRALNAAMTGDWSKAGFEREVSQTLAKRSGRETSGFFMPSDITMQRDTMPGYVVGQATQGGNLVENELRTGSFIDLLRAKAMVTRMGATVISGLVGNVEIPRQTGASTTYWLAENGKPTESNAVFDKVALKPKTIGAISSVSRNLLLQSSMNVEAFVRNELAVSLALGIDLAALCGSGTNNEPTGIANVPGICTVEGGENGAALTFDHLIDMETQVATENADVTNMYYLCNAATIGFLKKIKNSSGDYIWKPITEAVRNGFPGEVNGYAVGRSNQVRGGLTKGTATTCNEIYFGNWADLLVGEWGFLEIDVNRYGDSWKSGGVEIRALQSIDIAVRHPKSFCLFSDALLS
ncbi:phage major capsid protein [uncultured Parasutterella sp.]|uniref:phage major capsid protein n=1 Tax=uncultured Parasutterella sp. TaxID=1263098 RepID=UPI0025859EDC|nr:phage major capsid protein [uncultured Parasutterella sp.]